MAEPLLFADHHNNRAVEMRCSHNEFYARAVATEECRQAIALRDRARQLQLKLPGVARPESPTSSDTDLAAWLESLADAEIADQRRAAKWAALNNLVLDCNRRISDAARDISRVLASLNADLQALMDDVAKVVDRIGDARTPNEVIAAGVGDVWRKLYPLRRSYDQLRQAQEWAMLGRDELHNVRSKYVDDPHASDAWIANLENVFRGWREPDRTFRLSGDAPRRQPWPDDPIAMLVWLSESDAQVWIPAPAQLDKVHAARHRRLNPTPKQQQRLGPGWTIPAGAFDDDAPESVAAEI